MCAAPDILALGVQDLFRATSIHSLAVLLLLAPDTTCTLLSNSSHNLVWRSCCRYDFFRLFQPGQLATCKAPWMAHGSTTLHQPSPRTHVSVSISPVSLTQNVRILRSPQFAALAHGTCIGTAQSVEACISCTACGNAI